MLEDEVARLSLEEREEWEERAAIREYDAGIPRALAERLALDDVRRRRGYDSRRQGTLFGG